MTERRIFNLDNRPFVFKSDHPKEERIVELTDDYRGPDGCFILPELVAWDGVETSPGLVLAEPCDEELSDD